MNLTFGTHYSVSVAYANVLVELVKSRGFDVAPLCHSIQLSVRDLQEVDGYLSGEQFVTLVQTALQVTQDSDLGAHFGMALKISTHGYLGYAALSSATLGDAINVAQKYIATRLGWLNIELCYEETEAVIEFACIMPVSEDVERFLFQALFFSFGVIGENLLGVVPLQIYARTRLTPPVDQALMERFHIGGDPEFGQTVNQIRLPIEHLKLPLGMSDDASHQMMVAQCERALSRLDTRVDLVTKVKQHLRNSEGRFPTLEDVSKACFMSSRTFKRRLASHGTGYQELLDQERCERAITALRNGDDTVDAISEYLGYNDRSNFSRAFKRWTGMTPTQYRESHRKDEP